MSDQKVPPLKQLLADNGYEVMTGVGKIGVVGLLRAGASSNARNRSGGDGGRGARLERG